MMEVIFNKPMTRRLLPGGLALSLLACHAGEAANSSGSGGASASSSVASSSSSSGGGAPPTDDPQTFALAITAVDTRFTTREHFVAAVEMQLSGEPLAETFGRVLSGYSRDFLPTDQYFDPALNNPAVTMTPIPSPDPLGFSTAVESYEYSKQPMNNIAFESGAGTSLLFGPVLNPAGLNGAAARENLRLWMQSLASESDALGRFVFPTATPANPLGWPGIWPTLQPFVDWDPTVKASNASTGCSITSDDDPGATGALPCNDYECDATTLHLVDREKQVHKEIGPGASGWAGWKEALWVINYLQSMHDPNGGTVNSVPPDRLGDVGKPGNQVTGDGGVSGTYLGSSDIEGFQAGNFLQLVDNSMEQWLSSLTTSDGKALTGFASRMDALRYDEAAPLRWMPARISLVEEDDASGFPRPTSYAIADGGSHLMDLAGWLGASASFYALTDQANLSVGGTQPALAYFDGDPFPLQPQAPSGANTLHDRALAMIRLGVVDLLRMHTDPKSGMLVDDAAVVNGAVQRGATLSAPSAAYALLALRTVRRSLDSLLALYGNTKPDEHAVPTSLDAFPLQSGVFSKRLDDLIGGLAGALHEHLTTDDGRAYGGWDVGKAAPTDDATSLDAHAAAVRGLLLAYLATGSTKYRTRAEAVFQRVETVFYDRGARIYRPKAGDGSLEIVYTPLRFALLQSMLREMYEVVAIAPGREALGALIKARLLRLNKLVLNGWDDRDENGIVAWPEECARVVDELPRGGLQMAERTLSGETGSKSDKVDAGPRVITTDREQDCVPEVAAAGLPAALADSITFTLTPRKP